MRGYLPRLLLLLALVYSSYAQTTFPTDVQARFALPCQGVPGVYDPTTGNQCVQIPSSQQNSYLSSSIIITWGTGINPAYTSALQFDPYSNVQLGLGAGNAKPLGKLTHYNYPINCFTNCAQYIPTLFNWDLSLTVHVGASPISYTASYVMNLDETPNVDGTVNGGCPEAQGDPSWATVGGWNNKLPCCPYNTLVPQPNPDPNGAFSSINGFCSDKISFVSDTVPSTFVLSGTAYTLVILGISNSSTVAPGTGNTLQYFISQEYQQQVGYIWGYVTKACSTNSSCDDGNPCTQDLCIGGGCSHPPNTGMACTTQGQSTTNCITVACSGQGICVGTPINNGVSCNFGPANPTAPYTKECSSTQCFNGACIWRPVSGNPTCTTVTPHESQCYKPQCSGGSCGLVSTGTSKGSCVVANTVQESYIVNVKDCNKGTCTPLSQNSGTCALKVLSGSCQNSGLSTTPCNQRTCQSKTVSGVTVGTCSYSYQSGSCASLLSLVDCKSRTCSRKPTNTNVGTCSYSVNSAQGSCSYAGAKPPLSCKIRWCNGVGSCAYSNTGGSCSQSSSGVSTPPLQCNQRQCSGGSCVYSYQAWSGTSGSCTASFSYRECYRRTCHSTTNTQFPGSCGYTINNGGSCVGQASSQCNQRICHSGQCMYSYQLWGGTSGSCQTLALLACNVRVCKSTHFPTTYSTTAWGSCGYSGISTGSCTGIAADTSLCNIRQCSSGVCSYSQNNIGGSCATTSLTAIECNKRICQSKSGNQGVCSYSHTNNGGSCQGNWGNALFSSPFFPGCAQRKCSNGACSINVLSGTCNTQSFSTNDHACWKQTCKQITANGITAGSCSTGFKTGTACTAYPQRPCSTPLCNSTGYCYQSVANYPATRTCTDASNGKRTGSVCSPQYCNGLGSCLNYPSKMEGQSCLTPPDQNAATCITSACTQGTCIDTSNLGYNNSLPCASAPPNDPNRCVGYYCHYQSTSRFNHKGTCLREVNPLAVGTPCTIPNNPDSAADQACYDLRCNASGACQKFFHADNSYCGTPTSAQLSNGFGCSQYVCKQGTCNTNQPQPISEGNQCAGVQPCDPASPGCLIECQKFICQSGVCVLSDYREGQNCSFIKFESARDGTLIPRDSETGGSSGNDCARGVCTKGLCLAVNAKNGTSCGNRTLYNDNCYNDFCNSQGQCVFTPRRNCQGVIPLPSVCWDTVCEASSGDCHLTPNGVVDCSCIDDCTACTAAYDASNRNSTTSRTLSCYWCTGNAQTGFTAGCYNRMLPGSNVVLPPPTRAGSCYADNSPCGGGSGLTGGQTAGIILGTTGLAALASLLAAAAVLLVRYFTASGVPPANASLTDLAFDKNVKNNVFYEGATLSNYSAMYAEPKFITT